jgi:hypothetical protein
MQPQPSPEHQPMACQRLHGTQHRALLIPEILDEILRQADASTIHAAWQVSKRWRESAETAITWKRGRQAAWIGPSTLVVEYGQRLDPESPRRQPTPEELSVFVAELAKLISNQSEVFETCHLPAIFTEKYDLPEATAQRLNDFEDRMGGLYDQQAVSRRPHCYWLDFTQLELNPFLDVLFAQPVVVKSGRCEIGLSESLLRPELSASFLRNVGQIFFTHPPCRSLGLYVHNPEGARDDQDPIYSRFRFLERIHNEEGIRIEQLLRALNRQYRGALSIWNTQVADLKEKVRTGHWIDDIWTVPIRPMVYVIMDNPRMRQGVDIGFHQLRIMLLTDSGRSREKRQCEWTPRELIEPAKTTTPRRDVRWDLIGSH